MWFIQWSEAQGIPYRNRSCAHGENVAEDAADSGCSTLVGLDKGRMIVALNAESHQPSVSQVYDSCVLARTDNNPRLVTLEPA